MWSYLKLKFNQTFSQKLKQAGQTSVEYILLVLVVVVIANSVFVKLNEYLITNPDSFQNKYLSGYTAMFAGYNDGFSGQYKYFTIRR